jgi:Ca2+-binding EF-hand superfamily protein
VIDFEEFMTGLAICTKGNEDEKIRFLFSLFDLTGSGNIARNELLMMLHNTYKVTLGVAELEEQATA